ncbi:hypothetical protein IKW75_00430 [Candidatus Saccharibacteria bacterium]|nr:hypothetical protein [Candidatus Saccharibacteria bacterium]
MKKLTNLIAAFVLSIAGILLPLAQANVFAAPGDPKDTTVTVTNGIDYITDQGELLDFILDGTHQAKSGEAFHYLSNESGEHTLSFGIAFEYVLGYDLTDVKLNGTSVAFTPIDETGHSTITIGEDTSYTLGIYMEPKSGPTMHTVIWANPDVKDDIQDKDMIIKNGYAKVIGVYSENGLAIGKDTYSLNSGHPADGLEDGYGYIQALPGWKVVFEFTPIYGYQLVSVKANETPLAPQEATNQYTFTMPDTHVHFAADFAKTSDMVITGSDKVSSGAIKLGSGELDAGTAQLAVNDIELDSSKITNFEAAAGGAQISSYLDIDLFNVFYKGKADSEDVWSNQIHELEKEATITLKLADDVDVSRVVIVHNIDDGDKFEIIKIDSYDTAAHTITFKTKSFSNFAIALTAGAPDSGFATNTANSATATIAISSAAVTLIIFTAAWGAIRLIENKRVA